MIIVAKKQVAACFCLARIITGICCFCLQLSHTARVFLVKMEELVCPSWVDSSAHVRLDGQAPSANTVSLTSISNQILADNWQIAYVLAMELKYELYERLFLTMNIMRWHIANAPLEHISG